MTELRLDPRLNVDLDRGITRGVHTQLGLSEHALHRRVVSWAARTVKPLGPSVASSHVAGAAIEVFRVGGALVHVELEGGVLTAAIAAPRRQDLDDVERLLRQELPAVEYDDAQEVPVTFWTRAAHGAQRITRRIAVTPWSEIADNYGPDAARPMSVLISASHGFDGGQLILWHGPPGTGKTHALRSLAWEWRRWCDLHYIVDPDKLLGEHPDYLVELLFMNGEDDDFDIDGGTEQPSRWRLLVLEDCGELVAADARAQAGQGLSRLLNVVDGLIGQGLRLLVLITTNETVGKLHSALSRPGRCAGVIEFSSLTQDHAERWLVDHGGGSGPTGAATLAELYAHLAGRTAQGGGRRTGFA